MNYQMVKSEMHHFAPKNTVKGSNQISILLEIATALEVLLGSAALKHWELVHYLETFHLICISPKFVLYWQFLSSV